MRILQLQTGQGSTVWPIGRKCDQQFLVPLQQKLLWHSIIKIVIRIFPKHHLQTEDVAELFP